MPPMRSSRIRPCHRRPGLSRSRRGVLVLVLLLGLAIVVAGWRDGAAVLDGVDYDRMSIVPVGCVSRNGKSDAIEFEFFKGRGRPFFGRRRRGAVGGTSYVASISHYMRAHFNRAALERGGGNFTLPRDVGFLNCVLLEETADYDLPLYAKIGCRRSGSRSSGELRLVVYEDGRCTVPHAYRRKGQYRVGPLLLSDEVSFRPPFRVCQDCRSPEGVVSGAAGSSSIRRYSTWYDDEYISTNGQRRGGGSDDDDGEGATTDDGNPYFRRNDDVYDYYAAAAADGAGGDGNTDDANNYHEVNTDDGVYYRYRAHDDDFYTLDADGGRRGMMRNENTGEDDDVVPLLDSGRSLTGMETRKVYEADLLREMSLFQRRGLEDAPDNDYDDDRENASSWNMCQRVHEYGTACDSACRALGDSSFRIDEWCPSDALSLLALCAVAVVATASVYAARVGAHERAAMWSDEPGAPKPGMSPFAVLASSGFALATVAAMAIAGLVNETLCLASAMCAVLLLYVVRRELKNRLRGDSCECVEDGLQQCDGLECVEHKCEFAAFDDRTNSTTKSGIVDVRAVPTYIVLQDERNAQSMCSTLKSK